MKLNKSMDKLERLSKIIRKDTVSKTDVKDFLALILTFAKDNKQNLDSLSKEYLQTIQDTLQYIETNNQDYLSKIETESTNSKTEVKAQLKELKSLIKKAKAIKPVKGKDADEELIVDKVLEKIVLPEFKETVLDNGEQIVDKINALSLDEENKIDASHIKNLPESKMIRGGSTARNLYQLMDVNISAPTNAQVLKYNSTNNVWENGTDSASASWGEITGTLSNQTDLQTVLDTKTTKNFAIAMALALG